MDLHYFSSLVSDLNSFEVKLGGQQGQPPPGGLSFIVYENHDIAIAMSSSRADPVLGLNILLH